MSVIYKVYNYFLQGCALLAGLLLITMILLVISNIIGRSTGLYSQVWTIPVTDYCMQFMVMLAAPAILRRKGHIFMEVLQRYLSGKLRTVVERFVYFICLVVCVGVTWLAGGEAFQSFMQHTFDTRAIDIPAWILYFSLVLGFGLMAIEFARLFLITETMFEDSENRGLEI